jgi:hypothetical protein
MNLRLFLKLATLPLRRSWVLLGLMVLSYAQVLLALWLCGGMQKEIYKVQEYASVAKFITVQMKEETSSFDPVRDAFKGDDVSFEELKTEDVLKKMETDEPDIVATVRSTGNEGLQLLPKLLIVRGVIDSDAIEKVKLMTDVYKLDVSPVHHARLLSFYKHLSFELRIALFVILFLVLVQLLVFHRIQHKDLMDGLHNLIAWGVSGFKARVPGFLSILVLTALAGTISLFEWFGFQQWIWKENAFLGELSLDHHIGFPVTLFGFTFLSVAAMSLILSFSGRSSEE